MITLATLSQATAQEVFDQVAEHLIRQGEKSGINGNCLYRQGLLKCGAGCLIADEEYRPEMEGKDWKRLETLGLVPGDHLELIMNLQGAHDGYEVDSWPSRLESVTYRFSLKFDLENRHG